MEKLQQPERTPEIITKEINKAKEDLKSPDIVLEGPEERLSYLLDVIGTYENPKDIPIHIKIEYGALEDRGVDISSVKGKRRIQKELKDNIDKLNKELDSFAKEQEEQETDDREVLFEKLNSEVKRVQEVVANAYDRVSPLLDRVEDYIKENGSTGNERLDIQAALLLLADAEDDYYKYHRIIEKTEGPLSELQAILDKVKDAVDNDKGIGYAERDSKAILENIGKYLES